MLPIPPLDGSQIFSGIMIRRNPELVMKMQQYGPQVLFGLILIGVLTNVSILWMIMGPFVNFFMSIFAGIAL
jgi:Zn-dependent protease